MSSRFREDQGVSSGLVYAARRAPQRIATRPTLLVIITLYCLRNGVRRNTARHGPGSSFYCRYEVTVRYYVGFYRPGVGSKGMV